MRILSSGDEHWCEHLRFAECIKVHDFMVETARTERADLYLCGGDVYDRLSTPTEREANSEFLLKMAELCPVLIAKGNHDRPQDVALMRKLRGKHPIIVEERAGIHRIGSAAIGAVAWPEPAYLMQHAASSDVGAAQVRDALQAVLRWIGSQLDEHDGPRILLGHFMVDGSVLSTGQPLLGQPINVGLTDLALARAHLGVMGHIHKAQRFDVLGAPHWYTGSPFRTDFGQLEKKSVLFAEFDGARLVQTQEFETPCAPMVHVEASWDGDGFVGGYQIAAEQPGAEVRFRYKVAADQRTAASIAAAEWRDELLSMGVASVKLEPEVVTEKRARAPEVALARTAADKLEAQWASVKFDPGARRESLLAKARQLEEEVALAS